MTDVLIRDVPDDVLAAIDERASSEGVSRSEYLRRLLAREGAMRPGTTTVEDLRRFGALIQDLNDPKVMRDAWS